VLGGMREWGWSEELRYFVVDLREDIKEGEKGLVVVQGERLGREEFFFEVDSADLGFAKDGRSG
jgi:hypothetical protein